MKRNHWLCKFNIPIDADVIFYQNPRFFRSNSFKREQINKEYSELLLKAGKVKIYVISGITNNHHKHSKKREKICLVREYLK